MKIIDNKNSTLKSDLLTVIQDGGKVAIAASCFSIYAFQELKDSLKNINELRFIFTSPTFTTDKVDRQQREFYIPRLNRERTVYGSEFEVRLRNELTQRAIARECAEWIRQKACFKSNRTTQYMQGFINVDKTSYTPINGFTTYDLNTGYNKPDWQTDETYENVTHVVFDPSFADARPTTTFSWFHVMRELESITGLHYLNTSEVTNMEEMFCYCLKLTSLDLSHFNTAKVTKMYGMFDGCSGLTTLDLSGFNPPRMAETSSMFAYCTNLKTIYGRNWDTSIVSNSHNMFYRCNSLVGGQGTTYDPNHIDKAYAHIDGGPSNPGYFTKKPDRGDVTGDGNVDIGDVTALIDLLLGSGTISNPVADCNQDGSININDVTALIDYLLTSTW